MSFDNVYYKEFVYIHITTFIKMVVGKTVPEGGANLRKIGFRS